MTSFDPTSLIGRTPDVASGDAAQAATRGRGSFEEAMASASKRGDDLRDAADQLVSSAFVLPLLQQIRDDPFKSDLLHGGRGEEVFGQQLDVILADRITKSSRFGISEAMVRQFEPSANGPEVDLRG